MILIRFPNLKKYFLILGSVIICISAIILITPFFIGLNTQKQLPDLIKSASIMAGENIQITQFKRGWFHSSVTFQITSKDNAASTAIKAIIDQGPVILSNEGNNQNKMKFARIVIRNSDNTNFNNPYENLSEINQALDGKIKLYFKKQKIDIKWTHFEIFARDASWITEIDLKTKQQRPIYLYAKTANIFSAPFEITLMNFSVNSDRDIATLRASHVEFNDQNYDMTSQAFTKFIDLTVSNMKLIFNIDYFGNSKAVEGAVNILFSGDKVGYYYDKINNFHVGHVTGNAVFHSDDTETLKKIISTLETQVINSNASEAEMKQSLLHVYQLLYFEKPYQQFFPEKTTPSLWVNIASSTEWGKVGIAVMFKFLAPMPTNVEDFQNSTIVVASLMLPYKWLLNNLAMNYSIQHYSSQAPEIAAEQDIANLINAGDLKPFRNQTLLGLFKNRGV